MKRERLSTAETLGWSVVGFGAGLAGGLWAAGWLGRVTRHRLADELRAARAPTGTSGAALAAKVVAALAADPVLAPHTIGALSVSRGTVEVTGWVPNRGARARAIRLAGQVPGVNDLINSILVHGEDDFATPPKLNLEGRSA